MDLSRRIKNVQPSPTLAAGDLANELKAKGVDVISLTVGEPDFGTPTYINEAAKKAIDAHQGNHYTPASGMSELKQAILDYHQVTFKDNYSIDQVFVGNGVKNVLYSLFQVLINPQDEVLIPLPYWVSYTEQVKLAGGVPVIVEGNEADNFKINPDLLDEILTEKTKILIMNSPSNPTGAVYTKEELKKLGNWAVENNIIIISDEIYNRLVYDDLQPLSMSMLSEDIKKQIIVLNGVSKAFAMSGWRIGYALGNVEVISALSKFASQASGNPAGISQYAALAALTQDTGEVETMRQVFEKRLDVAYEMIISVPGFELSNKPQGAFYLFPNVKEAAAMTGYKTVDDFALALIEEAHVVTVAGSGFGSPDNIRLSYAVEPEIFAEGIKRIKMFIAEKTK